MEVIFITLILALICGLAGAWTRIFIQKKRDGTWPWGEDWQWGPITESFIGLICGFAAWLVYIITATPPTEWLQPLLYVAALALGLAGVDSLENLLTQYDPGA